MKVYQAILLGGLGLLGLMLLLSFTTINSGEVGVKTNFGVVQEASLQPGIHFALPLVSDIESMSVKTVAIPEEFGSLTKDSQKMKVTATTTIQLNPTNAPKAYANVGRKNEEIINVVLQPALLSAVKQVISQRDMTYIIENQAEISAEIEKVLKASLAGNSYINLYKVDVTGFVLDENVQNAIENKQIALQKQEQKKTELQTASIEAERLKKLETALTPAILLDKAIDKWDGHSLTPPTGGNLNVLVSPNQTKEVKK